LDEEIKMADRVNTYTLFAGTRRHVIRITNESDGSGESAVSKLDISGLTGPDGTPPTSVAIERIHGVVNGFNYVTLLAEHTTDDEIAVLAGGQIDIDMRNVGGMNDPESTGGTGDILLTTDGAVDGDSYDLVIQFKLKD
jgi:hypothetical protein